jgi:hypothetical protein
LRKRVLESIIKVIITKWFPFINLSRHVRENLSRQRRKGHIERLAVFPRKMKE